MAVLQLLSHPGIARLISTFRSPTTLHTPTPSTPPHPLHPHFLSPLPPVFVLDTKVQPIWFWNIAVEVISTVYWCTVRFPVTDKNSPWGIPPISSNIHVPALSSGQPIA